MAPPSFGPSAMCATRPAPLPTLRCAPDAGAQASWDKLDDLLADLQTRLS
jgi:hypothetical protein